MLPSMRTAVALATASPRHLPSFKFFKTPNGVRCLRLIFPYERDACKTKAGACSRHGDACATFFGTSAVPAKHKQVPAAGMAMPAPQFFLYARNAGPQNSQCFYSRICRKWVFLKLRFGLSVITTTTVQWSSQPVDSPKMLLIIAWACEWFFHCRMPLIAWVRLPPRARPDCREARDTAYTYLVWAA